MKKETEWMKYANCKGVNTEIFFSEKVKGLLYPAETVIKNFCRKCPVKDECLQWAIAYESPYSSNHGIYGGMTARQRQRFIRMKNGSSRNT